MVGRVGLVGMRVRFGCRARGVRSRIQPLGFRGSSIRRLVVTFQGAEGNKEKIKGVGADLVYKRDGVGCRLQGVGCRV